MSEIVEIQDPHGWMPANLAGGQLFAKADQVAGTIRLSSSEGQLMQLENGDWAISAEGYRACNVVAGIPCISPDTMKLPDGREVSNPFVEFDPATGTADKFWSHKITIGKSPLGTLVISAATVLFDIRVRFVKELIQRIEDNKDAGKLCMAGALTDEERRAGIFMPFQGELGVYGKHDNPDVIKVIQNLITNKEYGDRVVQTLAWKASIRQQPCMPSMKVKALNGLASILVVGYKLDLKEKQLNDLAKEFKETGKVAGAEIHELVGNASEDRDSLQEFSLLSEGGPRF